ncbi:pyridoxamine kinase [Ruminococcaceae bacterium OttesenSCG-928-L11]|nr:pyridoxamine kinase [Ruminococcaceae bacterium OttesenSCG-928-L11]
MQTSSTQLKRVAAIHDLSGFGRCSLSVILPVISTMGVQVCPVPTAVLSTHTGGLGDVVLRDLTDYLQPTLEHYRSLQLDFDCIYSGFLSSVEQVDHCLEFFRAFPNALMVVDPVLGDHGKAYRTCGPELRKRMVELVKVADIITPNLTEVSILLGMDYPHEPLTASTAKSMLAKLSELGPGQVVITGANLADNTLANLGYDRERGTYWRVNCTYVPVSYPGTGDIFASVLVGGLLTGDSLPIAMDRATKFIELAIKTTYSYNTDPRYGVMLEKSLNWLTKDNLLTGYQAL